MSTRMIIDKTIITGKLGMVITIFMKILNMSFTRIHNPKLVLAEVEMGTPVLDYYWTQGKNYHLAKMLRDGKLYFISSFQNRLFVT
ncbi:hypothetical protein AN396_10240 [Candidatus Epulonipiscium fishelsonii]|uniref:Uncharacterized protein n=1 Tax=Candidatus Epulonipiscium fishelsonii TaxID=77094 RepID=A0ACC8X9G8_9FIRM|nr:hypothetical protein AN396_10240 [Epulopiscium sp. SCG-B11WGA-EpuloA1]